MDPDATYEEFKQALRKLNALPIQSDAVEAAIDAVTINFYNLDHWLNTGGFLPTNWQRDEG